MRQREIHPHTRPARSPASTSTASVHQPRPRPKAAASEASSGPSTRSMVSSTGMPGVVLTDAAAEKELLTWRQTVSAAGFASESESASSTSALG